MSECDILVVEDESALREILVSIFEQENLSVRQAADGAEAVEMLKSGLRPTLALCDISMPKMTGLEFVRESLQIQPGLGIVMLTAHEENAKILDALRLGALDYLIKPFNNDTLIKLVYEFIRLAKSRSGDVLSQYSIERRRYFESLMRIKNANSQTSR